LIVRHSPPPILNGVFNSGHDDDNDKRNGVQTGVVGTENWKELKYYQPMLIGIGNRETNLSLHTLRMITNKK
jgi:hypothetical protein